jgi:hypothetical protein
MMLWNRLPLYDSVNLVVGLLIDPVVDHPAAAVSVAEVHIIYASAVFGTQQFRKFRPEWMAFQEPSSVGFENRVVEGARPIVKGP